METLEADIQKIDNQDITDKPIRGRPSITVVWPKGQFTVNDALLNPPNIGKISYSAMKAKIKKMISSGILISAGFGGNKTGRKSEKFQVI